ncbi:hypothetical protein NL676_025603 [Syzygium grande]|nr:hypothetical protein NL676_025603 [Syzygium grande]
MYSKGSLNPGVGGLPKRLQVKEGSHWRSKKPGWIHLEAAGQVTEDKHRIVEPKMPKARGLEESHRWELVEAAVRCGVHGLPSPEEDAKVEMAVG